MQDPVGPAGRSYSSTAGVQLYLRLEASLPAFGMHLVLLSRLLFLIKCLLNEKHKWSLLSQEHQDDVHGTGGRANIRDCVT